ncbi:DnaJ domain-containing protein [Nitrincola nitratireducens]|uniref:Dna-J like membrane chaperone protein n=1 Tax=Nitrincola nitratireducens TaxID=1229521 RepID=W9VHY2_9GAMM|nr:DnaJ domain-containing protein [Nitrincola nitratireducens]EXJ10215.1 Dna-J like membrane chaperone protein [Nitrincola nitratireducens]
MSPASFFFICASLLVGFFWIKAHPPQQRAKGLIKLLLVFLALIIVYLSLTGRVHVLGAFLGLFIPFLQRLFPWLIRLVPFLGVWLRKRASKKASSTATGNSSKVTTAMLEMTLEHDTGLMFGRVLQGAFSGRQLDDLNEQEFLQLLTDFRAQDFDSARLLETYLDKRFGDSWRDDDVQEDTNAQQIDSGNLSEQDAFDVLGLSPGASKEEIIAAHRRLMQKMHPDRGGSTWLAARINDAKRILLHK